MSQAGQHQAPAGTPPVVTLFEYYGAGATQLGEKLAQRLGLPFHGQAFSSAAIAGQAQSEDATDRALLANVLATLGGAYSTLEARELVATQADKFQMIAENNQAVQQFAQEGGVIVGRNAPVILAGRPNTLNVLLTGDVEDRVKRAAKFLGISEAESAKRRASEEDVRRQMSKTLYGWDPIDPQRYDMLINTSRITLDAAVNAIVDAVQQQTP
ncbi:MAG: cytidylate kinase-like family protein [Candidatus Nanopelagicales bacterium]|jgi:glucuronide carrier protein|nr:cytidylate kinase-like family protein [Candidatus Nanopelagicales bacterium]